MVCFSNMLIILYSMDILILQCGGLNLIDVPKGNRNTLKKSNRGNKHSEKPLVLRRQVNEALKNIENEKDENLKRKIGALVEQTIHDTQRKKDSIKQVKEEYINEPAYKAGFILSMVKKSRDVLNELFNVAVKHRVEWKALEHLKIYELIVHTNVDTTNLVRQLVEIHIQNLNGTKPNVKKRVMLL